MSNVLLYINFDLSGPFLRTVRLLSWRMKTLYFGSNRQIMELKERKVYFPPQIIAVPWMIVHFWCKKRAPGQLLKDIQYKLRYLWVTCNMKNLLIDDSTSVHTYSDQLSHFSEWWKKSMVSRNFAIRCMLLFHQD